MKDDIIKHAMKTYDALLPSEQLALHNKRPYAPGWNNGYFLARLLCVNVVRGECIGGNVLSFNYVSQSMLDDKLLSKLKRMIAHRH